MVLLTPDENVISYILPNGETLYRKQSTTNVLAFNSSNYIYNSAIITNEDLRYSCNIMAQYGQYLVPPPYPPPFGSGGYDPYVYMNFTTTGTFPSAYTVSSTTITIQKDGTFSMSPIAGETSDSSYDTEWRYKVFLNGTEVNSYAYPDVSTFSVVAGDQIRIKLANFPLFTRSWTVYTLGFGVELQTPYIQGSLTIYGNVETTFGNSVVNTLQTNFINLLKDNLPGAGNYNTRLYNPYFSSVYGKQLTLPSYASIYADSYFIILGPLTSDIVETDTGFGYRPPLVPGPSEFVLTTTSAKWYLPATFIPSYKGTFRLYAGIVYYFIVSFTAFDNHPTARAVSASFTITFGTTTIYTATVYFEAIQRYKQVCKTFTYKPTTTLTTTEIDGDNYIAVNSTTANVQLDNATTYGHQLHVMVMSGGKYSL